jgi:hypothetical protein
MKNNVPILAFLIGYAGAITNVVTEAKSVIGFFAAAASLVASLYAIAISHRRLRTMKPQNPFAPRPQPLRLRRRRPSRVKKLAARAARTFILLVALGAITGCSHVATSRARADHALTESNEELAEQSRALTTGIVDSLNTIPDASPISHSEPSTLEAGAARTSALRLAKRLAVADQEIEGLPLKRIPATAALAGDAQAAADIEDRFTEINSLRAHNKQLAQALRERDSALMELGAQFEAEKSKSIWRRIRTTIISTFGLGGLIALCIFCPAVIPILTRGLAWIVSKVPQLAGALGVVGKDAFDAVVKAVGHTRDQLKSTGSDSLHALDSNLRTELDSDHKALINQRRAALDV